MNSIENKVTITNSEVTTMNLDKAYSYIKKSEKIIEEFRPVKKSMEKYPADLAKNKGLDITNLVMVTVGGLGLASLVFVNTPLAIMFLTSLVLGMTSCVLSSYVHGSVYYGNPNQKFGRLLSCLYMNKKQRVWIDELQSLRKSNKQADEAHKLLIAKAVKELERKNVFTFLNDVNNKEVTSFVTADLETGKFKWVDRKEYEKQQKKELASNPELVARAILEKVVENKDLFD